MANYSGGKQQHHTQYTVFQIDDVYARGKMD